MKSAVIFYSYSGNTKKVAEILSEYLVASGSVDTMQLRPTDESKNFLSQCSRAFNHKKASLEPVTGDLTACDVICFGTPVWAFGPAPAMNAYLELCGGVAGKRVVLFTTYGSGTGNQRCLDYMQEQLSKKGATDFKQFSVQMGKVKDTALVLSKIKDIMRL